MQQQLVEQRLPLGRGLYSRKWAQPHCGCFGRWFGGIIATGKSYVDVRQVLDYLGLRVPVLHLRVLSARCGDRSRLCSRVKDDLPR